MPIKIADSLPARKTLEDENIFVMTEYRAMHQDIRPLKLLILNLMPIKITTETQLLRKLANTPLQIEVEFLQTISHEAKNVDKSHLDSFYRTFEEICGEMYDGMIITGAPVENLDFDQVDYWPELCEIMEWTKSNVHSTFHICWGAQAGLYYHFGIEKHTLPKKLFGVYEHSLTKPNSPLFRGFDNRFFIPHSRYTGVSPEDIERVPDLTLMASSDQAGVFAVKTESNRQFFITGHPEYDPETLALEYERDLKKGIEIDLPENYFTDNDPAKAPKVTWRAHGQLLYSNWLNYYVYQTTPYNLKKLPESNA